jgi:hypothetical protein
VTILRRMCRRPSVATLVVLFLALAGVAAFWAEPAVPVTGTTGPVAVTVTMDGGATDGKVAHIHAEATTGDLFEIRAHLCAGDAVVKNTFNFSFDGAFCSPSPVSAASDAETLVAIPAGSGGKGDLDFRVGEGTGQPWTDYWGNSHTLTCGPDHSCALVVQLQVTDNTVFFTAPLCYGGGCPTGTQPQTAGPVAAAKSGPTPPTSAPASTPAGAATGTAAGTATGTASGSASPAAGSAHGDATGDRGGGSASGAASGASSTGGGDDLAGVASAVFGAPAAHRAVRVFAAGLAGAIGGVLILLIVSRARRQMTGSAA